MAGQEDLAGLFDDAAEQEEDDDYQQEGATAEEAEGTVENEAEEDERAAAGSGDDEEEEDEEDNEYDLTDKFIVAEDEDEGDEGAEGEDDEAKQRRKKKRRRHIAALDEEDYELLEENQVTGIRRPKAERRRIRKKGDDAGPSTAAAGDKTAAEQLKDVLFGPDDEGLEDEIEEERRPAAAQRQQEAFEDEFEEEDDEFGDFIDDDLGEGQGDRPRRRKRISGLPAGVSAAAMREAQEIFGDVSGLLEMYAARRREAAEDEEELLEEEEEDDDAADALRMRQEERVRQRALRKVAATVEPGLMVANYMLPEDERIRTTDLPEREQLSRGPDPETVDHAACARWVYERVSGRAGREDWVVQLLEEGRLEVEGPPPDGRPRWGRDELMRGLRDCNGVRGVRHKREGDECRKWRDDEQAQAALQAAVLAVVDKLYERHEEVPLIALHRKEVAGELLSMRKEDLPGVTGQREEEQRRREKRPLFPQGAVQAKHRRIRRWEVLWAVAGYAQKWRRLQKRKEVRARAYRAAAEKAVAAAEQVAIAECITALDAADSAEAVDDVDHKFRLATLQTATEAALTALSLEDGGGAAVVRRPHRTSTYAVCKAAGLEEVVAALGLSPARFVENLEATYKRHEPENLKVAPEEFASEYIAEVGEFNTPEKVLRGACHMAAAQLAVEPVVRATVRRLYNRWVAVSTEPTVAGESVLDPFHVCGQVKRLRRKALSNFSGSDQFLRIHLAEKEGLVTARLHILEEDYQEQVVKELSDLYLSDAVATISVAWNALRSDVLADLLSRHLLPAFERETRVRLMAEARAVARRAWSDRLWAYATASPLQVKVPDADEENIEARRFMACCWGPGTPATVLVMLDARGGLVDLLHCGQLSGLMRRPPRAGRLGESHYDMFTDPKKSKDAERIRDFITEHSPHMVVVGASSPEARQLKEDLDTIRDHILEHQPRFLTSSDTGNLEIRHADETLAAAWEASAAAKAEMAEQPDLVRRAVALGRTALDPLAVLASLCGGRREILGVALHPLQTAVGAEELSAATEQTLITAVNQVGVDINAMAGSGWMAAPLQFVAGLGPRKARALLTAIGRNGGYTESRHELWKELGVLGNRVFRNCAPFIRVRASGAGMTNVHLDPLDDSRMHPERYQLAIEIAQSALGGGDEDEAIAVERAMSRPNDVEGLDLEVYNKHLMETRSLENQLATIIDLQMEFVAPYGELRPEAGPPTEDEVFWMLCGESPEALREGRRVEARVRYVTQDEAACTLADLSGLEAYVAADEMSSAGPVDPRDRVQPGDTVTARILKVEPRSFRVALTTRGDVLRDERHWEEEYCAKEDPAYVIPDERELKAKQDAQRRQAKKLFQPRTIRHPLFKNTSAGEAAEQLAEAETGECIFRPSARGTNQLCVSIKLHLSPEGSPLVLHVDIKEGAKSSTAMGGHLKLGRPLSITTMAGKRTVQYEDLDEVVARFVEPYASHFRALARHKHFKDGPWELVQEQLRKQKLRTKGAVYCLGIRFENPGFYYLGYIISNTPHREAFSITPDGFYFRSREFKSIDQLVGAFKKQPQAPDRAAPSATGIPYQGPSRSAARQPPAEAPRALPPAPSYAAPYEQQYAAYGVQQVPVAAAAAAAAAGPPGFSGGAYTNGAAAGWSAAAVPPQQGYGGGATYPPADPYAAQQQRGAYPPQQAYGQYGAGAGATQQQQIAAAYQQSLGYQQGRGPGGPPFPPPPSGYTHA